MMPESLCVVPWEPGQTLAEARQYVRPRWWGLYEDRHAGVKQQSAFFSAVQHFFPSQARRLALRAYAPSNLIPASCYIVMYGPLTGMQQL